MDCKALVDRTIIDWRKPPTFHAPGPTVPLTAVLPDEPPRAEEGAGISTKLGTIRLGRPPYRRLSLIDVSWRAVPADLVASGLRGEAQQAWRRADRVRSDLREAITRRMALEGLERDCAAAVCPELDCLRDWLQAQKRTVVPALEAERATARANAIASLEAIAENDASIAHASVALAILVQDAELGGVDEPRTEVLDRIVARCRTAVDHTAPSTPLGWFARYELGRALLDRDLREQAVAAWSAIDQVAPPEGFSSIEIAWRMADNQTAQDPVATWRSVLQRCQDRLDATDGLLCSTAAYKWMAAAFERGAWRDSIEAAARLLAYMDQTEGGIDAREEAYVVLAAALDALGGKIIESPPSLPERDLASASEKLAELAKARREGLAIEDELTTRVVDLVESCRDERGDAGIALTRVRVDIDHSGAIRVRAKPDAKGAKAGAFEACLERKGAWFFRDARSGVDAIVTD